jgi:hypothetical protein
MNIDKQISELYKLLDLMVESEASIFDVYQVEDGITYLQRRAADRPCDRR